PAESRTSCGCRADTATGTRTRCDFHTGGKVCRMNSQTDSWIEAALQELAAADAGAVVRPEIEVAVLHAWESQHAAARSDRPNRMAFVLGWRKMAAWMAVPAAGAAVAVSALLVERR